MTFEVESSETTIFQLLKSIERGDEVQLLKDGKAVATVIPQPVAGCATSRTPQQIEHAQQALRDMIALREKLNLGPFNMEEFKADRDYGRR